MRRLPVPGDRLRKHCGTQEKTIVGKPLICKNVLIMTSLDL